VGCFVGEPPAASEVSENVFTPCTRASSARMRRTKSPLAIGDQPSERGRPFLRHH
jgi:hypothetical protein